MNKLMIIGNLTRDPELRTTTSGINVCSFTVAVNRKISAQQRQAGQQPECDFFKVTAWRERAETCAKFLAKGKKVCVVGPVSVSTFTGNDGQTRASLDVTAEEIEFLSPRGENENTQAAPQETKTDPQTGFMQVEMNTDDLPF